MFKGMSFVLSLLSKTLLENLPCLFLSIEYALLICLSLLFLLL
jgi:hypothetical protein